MMSLFTPPTDNLYKFLAVSGVVLVIAGFYFPPVFFRQTGMEYLEQLRGSKELEVREEFAKERLDTLTLREQQTLDEKNKLQKRLDGLKSPSNSTEINKLEDQVKEDNREIQSIADSAYELRLNLALRRAQINYEETVGVNQRRISRLVLLIGWVMGLVGAATAIIGFRRWYRRLQMFQDRLVSKQSEAKLATDAANEPNELAKSNQPTQDNVPEPLK